MFCYSAAPERKHGEYDGWSQEMKNGERGRADHQHPDASDEGKKNSLEGVVNGWQRPPSEGIAGTPCREPNHRDPECGVDQGNHEVERDQPSIGGEHRNEGEGEDQNHEEGGLPRNSAVPHSLMVAYIPLGGCTA